MMKSYLFGSVGKIQAKGRTLHKLIWLREHLDPPSTEFCVWRKTKVSG